MGVVDMSKADMGVVGLAVMGENLILNMESRGLTVACYNRTVEKVDRFMNGRAKGKKIIGCHSIEELCASLNTPRKVMLMVKAGQPVDDLIDAILDHVEDGDIIIDGGNSHFADTIRRTAYVESKGKLYVGTGISGGEEGALLGPSIMPGGSPRAWPLVRPIFEAICARTDEGEACCAWVGEDGAGHFVKMVHNGIEYSDMQMISEAYLLMKDGLGMTNEDMRDIFARWNEAELDSYLIEITRDILGYKDEDGNTTLDLILDTAGQKGTGKWAAVAALDLGQPLTSIAEAVFARCLSALKEERLEASRILSGPEKGFDGDDRCVVEDLRKALYAGKLVSYAQGFQLMRAAAEEYAWNLNNAGIALTWRAGCIIRSVILDRIRKAYEDDPDLVNLLLDPFFRDAVEDAQHAWRRTVMSAVEMGVPMPAITSALVYYDGYRSGRLGANLLQAQRDYFGAHTYERVDKPRGESFHTDWTGHGGATASSTYDA